MLLRESLPHISILKTLEKLQNYWAEYDIFWQKLLVINLQVEELITITILTSKVVVVCLIIKFYLRLLLLDVQRHLVVDRQAVTWVTLTTQDYMNL